MSSDDETTALLEAWGAGDREALREILPRLYQELAERASAYLRRERGGHTLETAALVHELYLRLSAQERAHFHDREHFLAVAAHLMRRILIDHARRRGVQKRGSGRTLLALDQAATLAVAHDPELVALDEALQELAGIDRELARVVELRFFGGLENREVAALDRVSERTVVRRWRIAQAWLYERLRAGGAP